MGPKTIAYFGDELPTALPNAAIQAGFCVLQVSTEPKLRQLLKEADIDALVISHDVPDRKSIAGNSGRICLLLEASATVSDLLQELAFLFSKSNAIQ